MSALSAGNTEAVVEALRRLVVFGVDQTGAYRELFGPIADQLGDDVPTRLRSYLAEWAVSPENGVVILTGNAGTGKTAAAEEFCRALGADLPRTDELIEVAGALVAKDVSGIATREQRAGAFRHALADGGRRKVLICANDGILRDAAEDLSDEYPGLGIALDEALRQGASEHVIATVINVNRQRLTAPGLWSGVLDFVSRAELWRGCEGCPASEDDEYLAGCPMRANAQALRRPDTRAVLRLLIQTASGEAVPGMREILAILAYAICGDSSGDSGSSGMWTCPQVRDRFRDRGAIAFSASSAYYNLLFGAGLRPDIRERSPLLSALVRLGAGSSADLEVDDWLRDSGRADTTVRVLAGAPRPDDADGPLGGSRSALDIVRTSEGEMTFHCLGETVSISEDEAKVKAGLAAMVQADPPAQTMWRRRVLLEASGSLGGPSQAIARLTHLGLAADLVHLSQRVAAGSDVVTDIKQIVRGLNFLVTGYADASEGLIIPEPASLFARNPGSFRPARPAFVHAKVSAGSLRLDVPDRHPVDMMLDTDNVEVHLIVNSDPSLALTIGPRMYQVIREAELYRGPVGHGTAEMTDLRGFYGRVAVAEGIASEPGLQIADPSRSALVRVQLPHFTTHG